MEARRTAGPTPEERKAMVKQKLAMRGLEQRKIYDSADASMNTFRKPIAGQTNKPSSIGQRMAARGQQQAAEHGSLKSRQRAPPVKADISKQAIPVPTKTEKRDENVQPTVDTGAKTSESEQLAQTASTQAASSFNKINISLGARSPLDMAQLLSSMSDAKDQSSDRQQVHIRLPTVGSGDKEITVNTNEGNSKLLDAASLLRQWNEMKVSHSKPEAKSSLGLAVMAQSRV